MNPKKLISIVFLFMGLTVLGQPITHIGNDSRIAHGTLSNGFSYYLMSNQTVPGYADFILVSRTEEHAKLTEMHNFPDAEFFTFLDDMGLAAESTFKVQSYGDNTVYSFSDIALQRNSSVVDSMLLAILNIAAPVRPDMQAVIIVGDISTSSVLAKMQTLFQIIRKPADTPTERKTEKSTEPRKRFTYITDIEANKAKLDFDFTLDAIAAEYRTTAVPFIYDYFTDVAIGILKERANRELAHASFLPFGFDVKMIELTDSRCLRFSLQCATEDYVDAHEFLESYIERFIRYGITEDEFRREDENAYFAVEDLYRQRKSLPNSYFSAQCIRHFTEGYSIVGPEFRNEYIDQARISLDKDRMEAFIREMINPQNKYITCTAPIPTGGLEYFRIETMPLEPDTIPLLKVNIPAVKKESFLDKIFVNKSTGVVSRRLSNGAIMAYKPLNNTNEWIYFEAFARGGMSLLDNELLRWSDHIDNVAELCNINGLNAFDRKQMNSAMHLEINRKIGIDDRRITGKFHKSYIYEFMQLVTQYFQGSTPDDETFEKYRSVMMSSLPYKYNSPQTVLDEYAGDDIKIRQTGPELSDSALIADMDYHLLLDYVNRLFTDASDFTFTFVGDVFDRQMMHSVEGIIALLGQRRSGLPTSANDDFYIARYDLVQDRGVPMNTPRMISSYKLTFPSQFTLEEHIASRIAAKILEREAIRELAENGIIATAASRFLRYPQEAMTLEIRFESDYPAETNLENLFNGILERLSVKKVSPEEIKIIRDNIKLKEKYQAAHNAEYWKRVLRSRYLDRKDFHSRRDAALDAVSAEDIENLLKQCAEEGVVSLISVIPENK